MVLMRTDRTVNVSDQISLSSRTTDSLSPAMRQYILGPRPSLEGLLLHKGYIFASEIFSHSPLL